MTRPADPTTAAPSALVDHDQAAALDRLRAAFGPVEVLAVRTDAEPGPACASGSAGVQGCLLDPAVTL
jgi:hypothetical protein